MQKLDIFTIFDTKANAYLQPFFSTNRDTARREFSKAVNSDGQFNQFAEDYSLFHLGNFDQDEGTFELSQTPFHVCNAITLLTPSYDGPLLAPEGPADIKKSVSS